MKTLSRKLVVRVAIGQLIPINGVNEPAEVIRVENGEVIAKFHSTGEEFVLTGGTIE